MSLIPKDKLFTDAHQEALGILKERGVTLPDSPTAEQHQLLAQLIVHLQHQRQYNKLRYYEPYPYQKPLYHLHTMAQAVIASNRSGKSYSVGYAIACHLTGIYPSWWTDIRYKSGIKLIAAGSSSSQIREAIQETLFGTADKTEEISIGSGLLPRDLIIMDSIVTGADKRAIGGCQIKHSSGSRSMIITASYEQDRAVLQGGKADVIWLDEQPSDDEIVSELVRALAQTPTGQEGRLYLSATPLVGWTPMIKRFWNQTANHGMVRYSWDDVPLELLDQKTRDMLTSTWLPFEIDARTKGIPMAGTGAVFQIDFDAMIMKEPPALQPWYKRLAAIDFGRNPDPTVIIWMYYDDRTDTITVYDEHVARNQTPIEYTPQILSRGKDIPLAWPPDGKRKGYTETESVIVELTNKYGINTLSESFTNPDGSRGIDYGLQYIIQRIRLGKFRVSAHCTYLIEEMRQYHTETTGNGKVQFKGQDHAIDAMRYGALSIERFGRTTIGDINEDTYHRDRHFLDNYDINTY
jgi:phage terminase large subunit-like protein